MSSIFIAVVGTRRPQDIGLTYKEFKKILLEEYNYNFTIISGGAKGIDTWAKILALAGENKLKYIEFLPELFEMLPHEGKNNRYFKRNGLIAYSCIIMIAFPSFNKHGNISGGTLNAMNQAKNLGRPVFYLNKRKILKKY